MRTIVLFIITMVAGVACIGLETAKALPLSGVAAGDLLTASHRDDRWEVSLAGDCASQHRP
jgi:hypothetical protein